MPSKTVVAFKAPERFARVGIDWTRAGGTESERSMREAFLTYETSCGPNGLVSILLLAVVSRRQGSIAEDLRPPRSFTEVLLGTKLRKHRRGALEAVRDYLARRYHMVVISRKRLAATSPTTPMVEFQP